MARARDIGAQVLQIRYKHAEDGQHYRHDFDRAGTRLTPQPDGSLRIHNPAVRLWGDYGEMRYLDNPPGKKRRGKKHKSKGKGRGRARAKTAGRNPPARKRAKKRQPPAGFRSWSEWAARMQESRKQGGAMARKKGGRRSSARRNPPGRRRRSYRRNPPGRGLVGFTMDGATAGVAVTVGRIAARAIPAVANLPQAGPVGLAVQIGAGLGAALLASRMFSRSFGANMAAGTFSAAYESAIKRAGIPVISSALGDEGDVFSAYPTVGISAYPQYPELSSYPNAGIAGAYGVPASLDMQQ